MIVFFEDVMKALNHLKILMESKYKSTLFKVKEFLGENFKKRLIGRVGSFSICPMSSDLSSLYLIL